MDDTKTYPEIKPYKPEPETEEVVVEEVRPKRALIDIWPYIVIAILTCFVVAAAFAEVNDNKNDIRHDDRITELEQEITSLRGETTGLKTLLEERDETITNLQTEITDLQTLVDTQQEEITNLSVKKQQKQETEQTQTISDEKTYSASYSSGSVLTKSGGVNYYNGWKETWYSQQVLPGGGLNIPGRYVDEGGLVRDADGYICVACSDLAYGSVVQTSLGAGKVYDSGCASGVIDIYTNW